MPEIALPYSYPEVANIARSVINMMDRGEWATGIAYNSGERVWKDGMVWVARAYHISTALNAPPNADMWRQIVMQGATTERTYTIPVLQQSIMLPFWYEVGLQQIKRVLVDGVDITGQQGVPNSPITSPTWHWCEKMQPLGYLGCLYKTSSVIVLNPMHYMDATLPTAITVTYEERTIGSDPDLCLRAYDRRRMLSSLNPEKIETDYPGGHQYRVYFNPPADGLVIEMWRETQRVVGKGAGVKYKAHRHFMPYSRQGADEFPAQLSAGSISGLGIEENGFEGSTFTVNINRQFLRRNRSWKWCLFDPATGARSRLSAQTLVERKYTDLDNGIERSSGLVLQ